MKKPRVLFMVMTLLVSCVLLSAPLYAADDSPEISDSQADQIRQNCKQAQSILQRLQATDVSTRIKRGRIYENILNRLIAPFNARVSFNRYDAASLTAASSTISKEFNAFKSDYQSYADSFANLLSNNCEQNPREFYKLLTTTRAKREKVATDITNFNAGLDRYTEAFNSLQSSIGGQ